VVFGFEISAGGKWIQRTKKDGLKEKVLAEVSDWGHSICLNGCTINVGKGVSRRSWSLYSGWKNPRRTRGGVRQSSFIERRESLVLSGGGTEEEGPGSFGRSFFISLNLEEGRDYIITWLL
jgi:hypothetical protein